MNIGGHNMSWLNCDIRGGTASSSFAQRALLNAE